MSPDDDFNGDVAVERLDIATDAKIYAAVDEARKAYFAKLVYKSRNLSLKFSAFHIKFSKFLTMIINRVGKSNIT